MDFIRFHHYQLYVQTYFKDATINLDYCQDFIISTISPFFQGYHWFLYLLYFGLLPTFIFV